MLPVNNTYGPWPMSGKSSMAFILPALPLHASGLEHRT